MPTNQPSITSWSRLEPSCRLGDPAPGLQATLHDPAWLLARQWQLGEFAGQDAGSAATTTLAVATNTLDVCTVGSARLPLTVSTPLESLVQRESVRSGDEGWLWLAAESGAHFLRLLNAYGAGELRDAYVNGFALARPADGSSSGFAADSAAERLSGVVLGRLPDGRALHDSLSAALGRGAPYSAELPAAPAVPANLLDNVRKAAIAYLEWYDGGLIDEPVATTSWSTQRLQYDASIGANTSEGEVTFPADFAGDRLDWYSFDAAAVVPPPAASTSVTVNPTRVTFRGMPAARFWEVEDGRVDFGGAQAAPEDLVRLLLLDFALVFGQEWSMVPVVSPLGVISRITSLVVVDTFGRPTDIRHYSDVDGPDRVWRVFEPSASDASASALLLLVPTLLGDFESKPIEEVHLLRDEATRLAWAIERTVCGPAGTGVSRSAALDTPPGMSTSELTDLSYVLESAVPNAWLPMVPVTDPATQVFHVLRRAALVGAGEQGLPLGRLLTEANPFEVFEEEVPREGVRLQRSYRYARGSDGSTHLWIGRSKSSGAGEAESGLAFDRLEPDAAL